MLPRQWSRPKCSGLKVIIYLREEYLPNRVVDHMEESILDISGLLGSSWPAARPLSPFRGWQWAFVVVLWLLDIYPAVTYLWL